MNGGNSRYTVNISWSYVMACIPFLMSRSQVFLREPEVEGFLESLVN